jgi:hypothetical protein
MAGTGKSTIALTIAREYDERGRLGASFFFSRGGGDLGSSSKVVTTLAAQLANKLPDLKSHIYKAVADTDIGNLGLYYQWEKLILQPLSRLEESSHPLPLVLVVDALDECDGEEDVQLVLQLFATTKSLQNIQLRIFITSRPETPIRYGINDIQETAHQDFVLHNIPQSVIEHDISIFIKHNLKSIRRECNLATDWPGELVIRALVQNASELFIWAATACRFIREGKRFAVKRLDMILKGSSTSVIAPEKHLNEIYINVLEHSISSTYTDEERDKQYSILRHIFGSIVVLLSPLSAHSLSRLLRVTKLDVDQTLEDLHAILVIPEDQTHPLRLHHPSFRDFLLDKDRCGDSNFWVDEKQAHQTLADGCIRLMSASLKQDICGVDAPGMLMTDMERSQVEHFLPPEVQYACLYWVHHLQKSGAQLYDNDQVHQFLLVHLLHWLEALSWMQKISEGILAIVSLESVALVSIPTVYRKSLN